MLYNINFVAEQSKNFSTSSPNKYATKKPLVSCNSTSTQHLKSNHKT